MSEQTPVESNTQENSTTIQEVPVYLLIDTTEDTCCGASAKKTVCISFDFGDVCRQMVECDLTHKYNGSHFVQFGTKESSNYIVNQEYNIRIANNRVAVVKTNSTGHSAIRDRMANINAYTYDLSKTWDMSTVSYNDDDPFYCSHLNTDTHPSPFGFTPGTMIYYLHEQCRKFNTTEKFMCSLVLQAREHFQMVYKGSNDAFNTWTESIGMSTSCILPLDEHRKHECQLTTKVYSHTNESLRQILECERSYRCQICTLLGQNKKQRSIQDYEDEENSGNEDEENSGNEDEENSGNEYDYSVDNDNLE